MEIPSEIGVLDRTEFDCFFLLLGLLPQRMCHSTHLLKTACCDFTGYSGDHRGAGLTVRRELWRWNRCEQRAAGNSRLVGVLQVASQEEGVGFWEGKVKFSWKPWRRWLSDFKNKWRVSVLLTLYLIKGSWWYGCPHKTYSQCGLALTK